jgi:hypothetical protein
MAATQDRYQNMIILFHELCKLKEQDTDSLQFVAKKIKAELELVERYNLFGAGFSVDFKDILDSPITDFESYWAALSKAFYIQLINLLLHFEIIHSKAIECTKALDYSLAQLPFYIVNSWQQTGMPIDLAFREYAIIYSLGFLKHSKEETSFNSFKKEQNKDPWLGKFSKEKKISAKNRKKILQYFKNEAADYRTYIDDNFPEIKNEFSSYNTKICIYLIPQPRVKDTILVQVNQYKNQNNTELYLYPNYIQISPRFANLEEYLSDPSGISMGLFEENNPSKFQSLFIKMSIYFELHNIFMKKAQKQHLIEYLLYLIKGRGYKGHFEEDKQIIHLKKSGKELKCQLIFDDIPNIKQLEEIIKRQQNGINSIALKVVPDRETMDFLIESKIKYFVLDFLGRDQVNSRNFEMIHWFIKSRIKLLSFEHDNNYTIGNCLLERLKNCPKGLEGWADYEIVCTEIFDFLFRDSFRSFHSRIQSYTHDHIFRRDLIINNNYKDPASFWGQVKLDFNSNVIIVDFKNYNDPLEQNEFYLPSKYLGQITGKFGILFSRSGLSNAAKELQRRLLHSNNELLICLDDENVIGMINEKMSGQDPSYRLENLKFNLYEVL